MKSARSADLQLMGRFTLRDLFLFVLISGLLALCLKLQYDLEDHRQAYRHNISTLFTQSGYLEQVLNEDKADIAEVQQLQTAVVQTSILVRQLECSIADQDRRISACESAKGICE